MSTHLFSLIVKGRALVQNTPLQKWSFTIDLKIAVCLASVTNIFFFIKKKNSTKQIVRTFTHFEESCFK